MKTCPQQKYARQIWVCLVKYSSSEVSDSSEVGSQADPRELDNIVLARTSDGLVQNIVFSFIFLKVLSI